MDPELREFVESNTKHGKMTYQSCPELGIKGRRDMAHRIERLGLTRALFEGKTVLDVGCNAGHFCFHALHCGAAWVCGIDTEQACEAASEIRDWEGYGPATFLGGDWRNVSTPGMRRELSEVFDSSRVDVILFLSMRNVLGIPEWLSLGKHVIFENNNEKDVSQACTVLSRMGFGTVKVDGCTEDFGKRTIIKAWK